MGIVDQSKWEYRQLKLSQLVPYPAQDYFYANTTTRAEEEAFRRSLKDGQRDPIHLLPPNNRAGLPPYTMLDGHRRHAGLVANGETQAKVVIRHDLADAAAAAVESIFLEFSRRRDLHQIDRAKIALRQFQIEKGRPRGEVRRCEEGEARERVGKAIGMTGRNLSRYFRLLLTPPEVQNAVRDGNLPLVQGEKVSWLTKPQQAEIARRIGAGENAKSVVRDYITPANGRHKKAADAFSRFVKDMERVLADLEDRPHEVYCLTAREHTALLDRTRRLLTKLIAQGRRKPGDLTKLFRKFGHPQDDK